MPLGVLLGAGVFRVGTRGVLGRAWGALELPWGATWGGVLGCWGSPSVV